MTATGHCPVFVRPRRAKTSFPGREAAPLRFAAPSAWVQKGSWAGLRSAQCQRRHAVLAWYRPAFWLARPPQQQHCPPAHATGREGGPGNTGNRSLQPFPKKQKHRKSLWRPVAGVTAQWAGFWTGLGHDAGAATVPTEPPPGGVNLGRVLTDGRVQQLTFLSANGPSDAPAAYLSCGWEVFHTHVGGRNHCRCRLLHVPCTSHFTGQQTT